METNLTALDVIYRLLKQAPFITGTSYSGTKITGGVYKLKRPDGSAYEDIVISSLPMTATDVQQCLVNVNIHVADLDANLTNTISPRLQKQPNTKRMGELAKAAADYLSWVSASPYALYVESVSVLQEAAAAEHYVNIRIQYRTHKTVQTS